MRKASILAWTAPLLLLSALAPAQTYRCNTDNLEFTIDPSGISQGVLTAFDDLHRATAYPGSLRLYADRSGKQFWVFRNRMSLPDSAFANHGALAPTVFSKNTFNTVTIAVDAPQESWMRVEEKNTVRAPADLFRIFSRTVSTSTQDFPIRCAAE